MSPIDNNIGHIILPIPLPTAYYTHYKLFLFCIYIRLYTCIRITVMGLYILVLHRPIYALQICCMKVTCDGHTVDYWLHNSLCKKFAV